MGLNQTASFYSSLWLKSWIVKTVGESPKKWKKTGRETWLQGHAPHVLIQQKPSKGPRKKKKKKKTSQNDKEATPKPKNTKDLKTLDLPSRTPQKKIKIFPKRPFRRAKGLKKSPEVRKPRLNNEAPWSASYPSHSTIARLPWLIDRQSLKATKLPLSNVSRGLEKQRFFFYTKKRTPSNSKLSLKKCC